MGATRPVAAAPTKERAAGAGGPPPERWMVLGLRQRNAWFPVFAGLLLTGQPAEAASNKVRITSLSDVAFGTIANLGVDGIRSQNLCLFADTAANGYNITATGTGPGGAFQLSAGPRSMAYEVQWSSASGQNSGTQLSPNVPLTGQVSSATHQVCANGPATSASLIIVLRATALSSATAGTYSGNLTLLVGAE